MVQLRTLPAGDVSRAHLILALSDGLSYREIERKLDASAPKVALWKSRFEQSGMPGLQG
jgi:transposase